MMRCFMIIKKIGIICELNPVRTFIIDRFYKTIPDSRIRVSLSIIDDIILKINNNVIENILENNHDLKKIYYIGSHLRKRLGMNNRFLEQPNLMKLLLNK